MVRRRRLEAPSAEELSKYEEEFRRETSRPVAPSAAPPIAQVSAASARDMQPGSADQRAEIARDRADAGLYRNADEKGLVIRELPLDDIATDMLVRDRTVLDKDELEELKGSIAAGGLRLPIEVCPMEPGSLTGDAGRSRPFGLLSGYRRLLAVRELLAETGRDEYRTIRALVRGPQTSGRAFAAMVEENEVRASLSHFERGRIAVMAAKQGAFSNTEAAVDALFTQASKAKRSKVRSFALIFEELGDMLSFPESITERQGLRLAAALRDGGEPRLREVLAAGQGVTAEEEWALLDAAITETTVAPKKSRGGRPRRLPPAGWQDDSTLHLSNGTVLRRMQDSQGHLLRIEGRHVDAELMDLVMIELRNLLERP